MKNVYVGTKTNNGIAICRVIDSDIATGNVIAYNRETGKTGLLKRENIVRLDANIVKLAESTEIEGVK